MDELSAEKDHVGTAKVGVENTIRRLGNGISGISAPKLLGMLAAGAIAPLVASGVPLVGAVVGAALGVTGSVGVNLLTDIIAGRWSIDPDPDPDRDPDREAGGTHPATITEHQMAARIEAACALDGERAAAVRMEIASLFRRIDIVGIAIGAAGRAGGRDLQSTLATAFGELSVEFQEFASVLTDVQGVVWRIDEALRRQEAALRADRARASDDSFMLRLTLNKLADLEAQMRAATPAPLPAAPRWSSCPYLGLAPFNEQHASLFYGRRELTARLVNKLVESLDGAYMILIAAPSGAGKSSLLRAGLIPQLAAGTVVPGCQAWPRRIFTPTTAPLRELANHLAGLTAAEPDLVFQALSGDPSHAATMVSQAISVHERALRASGPSRSPAVPSRLVLVVDQLEELFIASDESDSALRVQRAAFIAALHAIASARRHPDGPCLASVVLGIRGDYMDRAMANAPLRESVDRGLFLVPMMTESELRLAITGPAAEAGVEVEARLPEVILEDLRTPQSSGGFEVGVLSVLSQAMFTAWQYRDSHGLTVRGYRRAGGVADAVQTWAEAVFHGLAKADKAIARTILTHLTFVTNDGALARRRATRADLITAAGADPADTVRLLDLFAAKRLVTLDEETVEIAHDVLLHSWPRLRGWLDGDRADRVMLNALVDDANGWHQQRRDTAYLYRGSQLAAVEYATTRWARDPTRFPALPGTAKSFLAASSRFAHRNTLLRRVATTVVAVLAIAAVSAAGVAYRYAAKTDQEYTLSLSRDLAARSLRQNAVDPIAARRLAVAAWNVAPTPEARDAMGVLLGDDRGLIGHTNGVAATVYSPDGSILASAGGDRTIRLWDPTTQTTLGPALVGHTKEIQALAFSPDGRLLASSGLDETIRLWDPKRRTLLRTIETGHAKRVWSLAFNSGGTQLATADLSGEIRRWDPATGAQVGRPIVTGDDALLAVTYCPASAGLGSAGTSGAVQGPAGTSGGAQGSAGMSGAVLDSAGTSGALLASAGSSGVVRLWNAATGTAAGQLDAGDHRQINAMALSGDGTTLVEAGDAGRLRTWNLATRQQRALPPAAGDIYALALNPAATRLAAAGSDSMIRIWDTASGNQIGQPLTGHTDRVLALGFNRDGTQLASGSFDRTVRLWNPVKVGPIGLPALHPASRVTLAAFVSGSRTVLTARSPGIVQAWDAETGVPTGTEYGGVAAAAVDPTGTAAAVADAQGRLRLLDPSTTQPAGTPFGAGDQIVNALALGPDARTLAVGYGDGSVRLLDAATGRQFGPVLRGRSEPIRLIAIDPTGRMLAAVADDGLWVWSLTGGDPTATKVTIAGQEDTVALAFSPDGHLLATGNLDHSVRLWSPSTGRQFGRSMDAHTDSVWALAFSPDGRTLASAGNDMVVRLWDPRSQEQSGAPIVGHTGMVRTLGFSSDGRKLVTGGNDQSVRLWSLDPFLHPASSLCQRYGRLDADAWAQLHTGRPLPQGCANA